MHIASAITGLIASIFVLAGSVIWTGIIKKAGHINSLTLQPSQTPIGIHVSPDRGFYYTWASYASLVVNIPIQIIIFMSVLFYDLIITVPEP